MSSSPPDLQGRSVSEIAPDYLDAVLAAIGSALAASASAQRAATRDLVVSPLERRSRLEQLIDDLVSSGGKMLRPRLALLGHLAVSTASGRCAPEGTGRPETSASGPGRPCAETIAAAATSPQLVALGAAFELLHVFGLLQDDVMDESATRRGRPTAHERLADGDPWRGADGARFGEADGARFGESVAILAGDLAFTLAQRQVRGLPEAVTDAWDDTVVELVQGQRLDLVFAAEGRVDLASTRRVAAMKSGAYTFTRPLELGALLAHETGPQTKGEWQEGGRQEAERQGGGRHEGERREAPEYLRQIGEHLGAAFALSDDILGIWGDPAVTGKPAGDDLSQRKPSTVLGLADRATRGEVGRALRAVPGPPSPRQVARLVDVMDRAGVREQAEHHIAAHIAGARAQLGHVRCAHVRAELAQVADRLLHRPA